MKTFTVTEQATKGFTLNYNPEGQQEFMGVPIGHAIHKTMFEGFNTHEQTQSIWQMLDVAMDSDLGTLRLVKEKNPRDKRALVHVSTPPGVDGTIRLFANTMVETYNEARDVVERTANPFPSPGIKLLAEKPQANGFGPEFLLLMSPGSSFRISRTGNLYDNVEKKHGSPEFVVIWNARWDHRAEFDRFRNPDPEKYLQFLHGELRKSDFTKDQWDSFLYKQNPMSFWSGFRMHTRQKRHGDM